MNKQYLILGIGAIAVIFLIMRSRSSSAPTTESMPTYNAPPSIAYIPGDSTNQIAERVENRRIASELYSNTLQYDIVNKALYLEAARTGVDKGRLDALFGRAKGAKPLL